MQLGEAPSQRDNYEIVEDLSQIHGITSLLANAVIPRASYYKRRAIQSQRKARHDLDQELKEHKRKFHATAPQQKMVTDITFISNGEKFYYLSVIQDLFSNETVAWQLSERNDVKLVFDTVEQWTRKS